MFNIEFLHVIREFEYRAVVRRLAPHAHVLEIGGGTGYQAKRLTEDNFKVASIDIPNSNYAGNLEFPVQPYDGRIIPFPDRSFDIVYSSNVLEHVVDLPQLQSEVKRVLRPGGYCIHLMPTGAWRLWTNLTHYVELCQRLVSLAPRLVPKGKTRTAFSDVKNVARLMTDTAKHYAVVPRHGEVGNAFTEVWTFSERWWLHHFEAENWVVDEATPSGLFYTGHMVLGNRISLSARQKIARILGSACVIYKVRPAVIANRHPV